jgi:DNA-directed RNA polymerase specialized sigma24 family protein
VEHALTELEALDPRKCRIAELALIVGLEQTEIAATLGLSLSTVERDLRFSRAWLKTRLTGNTATQIDAAAPGNGH